MARAVSVQLTAQVDGFIASMNRAAASTQAFASKTAANIAKNDVHLNRLGNTAGVMGAAVALGIGAAVKSAADFDQAMSNVSATGQDAKSNLQALRDAAIDAGAKTAFSATEAAEGIENLAKAGVSAKDTLGGGLKGALDLAAAGQISVSAAAETAATAMTQFNLAGKDVPHIADLLAAGAGKAQGEVSDMAQALNQSGLVASQFGLSIEETTGTLAAFASAGLLGSDAGTSFKTMLLRLANPSQEAADAMKDLGINAYDAQGNFVGIESLAGQLQKSMSGLSAETRDAALSTIFGSDAIRAANVLYKEGASGIKDWTAAVDDQGFAAETAAERMNNLKGDIEQFKGSLETALIGLGEGGQGPLRSLVQGVTDAVNAFNQLPAGVKQGALVVGALAAAALLGVAAISKLAVAAVETSAALKALGITATSTRARLASLNGAGLLAVAGFVAVQAASAALDGQLDKNSAGIEGYKDSLSKLGKSSDQIDGQLKTFGTSWQLFGQGIGDTRTALKALADTQNPVSQGFRKIGDALGMSSTAGILADEFDKMDKALTQMKPEDAAAAFKKLSDEGRMVGLTTEQINATFDDYLKSLRDQGAATDQAAAAADQEAQALGFTSAAAQKAAEDIQAATDAMYANANAALTLSGNAIAVEQAMDDAAKAAKKNGETLDINTAKGRANQAALDQLAAATLTATQAMVEQKKPAADIVATNERAKESYIKTARAMGATKTEAEDMANALFKVPKEIRSQVVVAGAKVSKQEAADLNKALKDIPPEKRAEIVTIAKTQGAEAAKKAIAEVKAKKVEAEVIGIIKGAKDVDSAMKALKDRKVLAKANGDERGAKIVDAAMKALKDKKVNAKALPSGEAGVRSLKGAVDSLHDKTVTITTKRVTEYSSRSGKVEASGKRIKDPGATGGLMTAAGFIMRGPLRRSQGGPVWGAGTATSDSIPALLSNGEFVINARSVSMIGADRLAHMNNTGTLPGFAAGGIVGAPTGFGVDQALILRLIAQLSTPLTAITAAARALGAARSVKTREDRETAAAKAAYERAVAADKKRNTKGTEKAKDKAKDAYDKQLDQQRDATAKLTDATRNLADANAAAADSARSMSDQFSAAFRSGSVDPKDWLSSMLGGSVELTAFRGQIASLRKAGLAESLIQQILDQGATTGGETAANILAGGGALVKQLNAANASLEKAADALGYLGTLAPQRKALGGPVYGPGTATSDSIPARLSNGEYVVNAASTSAHRPLLDAINYGRTVVAPARFAQTHYARGGYVNTGSGAAIDTRMIAAAVEDGLSRASFTGYIDGQPFRMIVTSELRARGRTANRTR